MTPVAAVMGARRDIRPREALRWGGSIAAVAAIHILALWLLSGRQTPFSRPNDPSPPVTIDLPAPEPQKQDAPAEPAKPLPPESPPGPIAEKPAPQETPPTQSAPPSTPSNQTTYKLPDFPSMDWAETVLAPSKTEEQRRTAAATSSTSWQRALVAHINRFQRYPAGAIASAGTATVIFVISPSGQVLSAKLASSSGDAALDRETVAMIYRASPVPAPPGASENVTVAHSIHFQR